MPSRRADRSPPPRNFNDYILTREQGKNSGIVNISSRLLKDVPGIVGEPWQNGDDNTSISDQIDIGFPFEFDGTTYTKFVVTVNGWMALVDPSVGSFVYTDILEPPATPQIIGENRRIKPSYLWDHNHILLAPWFCERLANTAKDIRSSGDGGLPFPITNSIFTDLYDKGYWGSISDAASSNKDPINYAVKYCVQERTTAGRRLIVRWNSWISLTMPLDPGYYKSKITFEVVLYENGRIEFRYSPRKDHITYSSIVAADPSSERAVASIGIFKRGRPGWNFRDFSPGLGYKDSQRTLYKLGGSVYDPSFTDNIAAVVKPYALNLKLSTNWPADDLGGGKFVFQPPMLRRKVLPRLIIKDIDSRNIMPTVARTGDPRLGNDSIMFDDRRSIAYVQGVVNYPTTLPRFYGNTSEGISDRQNLFSGDFVLSASVVKSNVQQFIGNEDKKYIAPFQDHKRFENDPDADDLFFSVGTSLSEVGIGFSQSLKAKTQLKMSFSVDDKTILPGVSSSIYYYNKRNRRWQYPIAAVNVDPFGVTEIPSAKMDVPEAPFPLGTHRIVETDRGFNAYGVPICSGTSEVADRIPPSVERNGTDSIFNALWTSENETKALNKQYGNSFQTHIRYSPLEEETFVLPISQPFLIEKAVIELPIEAGPSWFLDKTQCFLPEASRPPLNHPYATYTTNSLGQDIGDLSATPYSYRSNGFHIGGPALTVALFNNVKTGINSSRRELILSGTITHNRDNETEIKLYDYEGNINETWQVVPRGFNAYGTPSIVVNPNYIEVTGDGISSPIVRKEFFTGSVRIKSQASISNGVIIRDTIFADYSDESPLVAADGLPAVIDHVFNAGSWKMSPPLAPLGSEPLSFFVEKPDAENVRVYGFREKTIVGVNNLCRGATGFDQSARSIFGKEFISSNLESYRNPFNEYDVNNVQGYLKVATKGDYPKIFFTQVVSKQKSAASPYLVFPGDKLSITVSKSRPFCFDDSIPSGSMFGPLSHDIKLNTGSLNITLYGSLISNGTEFHDTLNQPLASEAIHELFAGGTKTW